jgi:hypothetical protein
MGAVALLHLAAGAFLALLAWLMPRRVAGARRAAPAVLLLDIAPFAIGAGLLGFASGRPLFAGLVTLALGAGFTLADYTMRQTLREPVVFSAASELPQVFTHPHLYLPFAGPGLVVGGAAAAVGAALALLVVEPPLWTPHPLDALLAVALIAACIWLLAREPLLGAAAGVLRRLDPSGEPFADAASLGPFAMLLVHTIIARAERAARQRKLAAPPVTRERSEAAGERIGEPAGPIIIVPSVAADPARPVARVRGVLRRLGGVRPTRRAGVGRKYDARRIRGSDRDARERTRLRPVQPLLRPGAGADRLAGLAAAQRGVSHDLPPPL